MQRGFRRLGFANPLRGFIEPQDVGGNGKRKIIKWEKKNHRHIREIAKREGVSINQFISTAVSEKVSAILTEEYLSDRASRAKKGTLKSILDNVPARAPLPEDRLP